MNIGIVVYSKTGNTLDVAKQLDAALKLNGHHSTIESVTPVDPDEYHVEKIQIKEKHDLNQYDFLVFASPVNGFALAASMKRYMMDITSLNVPAACFVTKALPFNWTGGNQAVGKIEKYVTRLGSKVVYRSIVHQGKPQEVEECVNGMLHSL